MTKSNGREIPFAETYSEATKNDIEKAFLGHGVSYLIKVIKVRDMKTGFFDTKTKYSFYINRFQQEEAKSAILEKELNNGEIVYLN